MSDEESYWPRFVIASVVIAVATALATESAKVVADKLRERWGMKREDKS